MLSCFDLPNWIYWHWSLSLFSLFVHKSIEYQTFTHTQNVHWNDSFCLPVSSQWNATKSQIFSGQSCRFFSTRFSLFDQRVGKPDRNIIEWQLTTQSLKEQYWLWLAHVFASRMPFETCDWPFFAVVVVHTILFSLCHFRNAHIDMIDYNCEIIGQQQWQRRQQQTQRIYLLHNSTSHMVLFIAINQANVLSMNCSYACKWRHTIFEWVFTNWETNKSTKILQ